MVPDVLVVAAAIVDDIRSPGRLLAAQRAHPAALAGKWEFPGGKVEAGETPQQALHRELAEELHIAVELGPECAPASGYWPLGERLRMRLWLATVAEGEPTVTSSHRQLRWLERAEWSQLDWLEPDAPIVAELARRCGAANTCHPAAGLRPGELTAPIRPPRRMIPPQ